MAIAVEVASGSGIINVDRRAEHLKNSGAVHFQFSVFLSLSNMTDDSLQ